jgi:hypothetical protein
VARHHAAEAVDDPVAFLEFDAVFPSTVKASRRFQAQFSAAYRRIAAHGSIAAMEHEPDRERIGDVP